MGEGDSEVGSALGSFPEEILPFVARLSSMECAFEAGVCSLSSPILFTATTFTDFALG